MLRCHTIASSTNADRVALAAGLKGLRVDWVEHPFDDRAPVVALSGQPLVPVLEHDGRVIADSPAILRHLDDAFPEPRLWPEDDDVLRARVDVLIGWFNHVWKGPPNELEGLWRLGDRTSDRALALAAELATWTQWFEDLLGAGPYLLGDRLTAADVVVWPFLRKAATGGPYLFYEVLQTCCGVHEQPRIMAWIERMEALPRA